MLVRSKLSYEKKQRKHQSKRSKQKKSSRKRKKLDNSTIIGIILGAIIVIGGLFLDRIVWDKFHIGMYYRASRPRNSVSGGMCIVFCLLAVLFLIALFIFKRVQYKKEKIDLPTWKLFLFSIPIVIVLLAAFTVWRVWRIIS